MDKGCVLCRIQFDMECQAEQYNQIIFEGLHHYIISGLGALVPGYALLVTKQHIDNYSQLPARYCSEFIELFYRIENAFLDKFGEITIFEHGSLEGSSSGSCVNHAHLHFFAKDISIYNCMDKIFPNYHDNNIESLAQTNYTKPYLYIKQQHHKGRIYMPNTPLPRQFIRQKIANIMQMEALWDYRFHPFLDNIIKTQQFLKEYF